MAVSYCTGVSKDAQQIGNLERDLPAQIKKTVIWGEKTRNLGYDYEISNI